MCYFGTRRSFAALYLWGEGSTLDEFSGLTGDIYDAALDRSLWDQTLKRVFSAAGANAGGLPVPNRRRGPGQSIVPVNFDPDELRKYDEYYGRIDPLASILEQIPAGAIVTARAITTERQRRGEFYNEWAHPNELGDAVFVNLLTAIPSTRRRSL